MTVKNGRYCSAAPACLPAFMRPSADDDPPLAPSNVCY